ncbi:MAG: SMC-Scp complex subunit ScpB, partial [Chitinophagaceae bacterium]
MEIGNIIPHIEALIFASEKPLTAIELTELANNAFGFMDEKLTLEQIQTAIDGIVEKYRSEFYPFEVRESGGGLQFLTKKEYHKTVAQLNGEKFLKRLSTAALETLSIIAYKQPVTKGEIEAIRGVSSDYAIQRLLEKELVVITGRNEKLPGHPLVYATSRIFMDYFGINSPDDLPKLKEVFDEAAVNPTLMDGINTAGERDENDSTSGENELLAVTQNGELTTARLNPDAKDFPRKTAETDHPGDNDATPESDEAGARSFVEGETGDRPQEVDSTEITGEENASSVSVGKPGDDDAILADAETQDDLAGDIEDNNLADDLDDVNNNDEDKVDDVEGETDQELGINEDAQNGDAEDGIDKIGDDEEDEDDEEADQTVEEEVDADEEEVDADEDEEDADDADEEVDTDDDDEEEDGDDD